MRLLLFVLAFCVGLVGTGSSAQAQNYPWCAHYGTGFDGVNCGFTTFQQCMDTVSGIGGFCQPNTQYPPPSHQLRKLQDRYPY